MLPPAALPPYLQRTPALPYFAALPPPYATPYTPLSAPCPPPPLALPQQRARCRCALLAPNAERATPCPAGLDYLPCWWMPYLPACVCVPCLTRLAFYYFPNCLAVDFDSCWFLPRRTLLIFCYAVLVLLLLPCRTLRDCPPPYLVPNLALTLVLVPLAVWLRCCLAPNTLPALIWVVGHRCRPRLPCPLPAVVLVMIASYLALIYSVDGADVDTPLALPCLPVMPVPCLIWRLPYLPACAPCLALPCCCPLAPVAACLPCLAVPRCLPAFAGRCSRDGTLNYGAPLPPLPPTLVPAVARCSLVCLALPCLTPAACPPASALPPLCPAPLPPPAACGDGWWVIPFMPRWWMCPCLSPTLPCTSPCLALALAPCAVAVWLQDPFLPALPCPCLPLTLPCLLSLPLPWDCDACLSLAPLPCLDCPTHP